MATSPSRDPRVCKILSLITSAKSPVGRIVLAHSKERREQATNEAERITTELGRLIEKVLRLDLPPIDSRVDKQEWEDDFRDVLTAIGERARPLTTRAKDLTDDLGFDTTEKHVRERRIQIHKTIQNELSHLDRDRDRLWQLGRHIVRKRVVETGLSKTDSCPDYVTLDQMAAIVSRSKGTLERYLHNKKYQEKHGMPEPDVEGGGGKPHEWNWANIRPWLEQTFKKDLPERFPSSRFNQ